jgi:ferrous iron transport protein A
MMTAVKQISLDQLPVGQPAVLVRVGGEKATRRRLLDMGMLPGEIIKIKKIAPLGDPLELEVKHYQLSLRKHEAHQILVEVV